MDPFEFSLFRRDCVTSNILALLSCIEGIPIKMFFGLGNPLPASFLAPIGYWGLVYWYTSCQRLRDVPFDDFQENI